MSEPLRLGIAGVGIVGAGVIKIIQKHAELLALRAGRPIKIVAVSAQNKTKDRGVDLSGYAWESDPLVLAKRPDIDVCVELIGGSEGAARDAVTAALESGKHVVTANKALLAHHGFALASLAEKNGGSLNYEAAVAGGIPVIKAMREAFAGNQINSVYGILNGTCNYMLTAMRESGRDFDVILKEAQAKGYAEADPSFDVDGIDAGHKLCILSALAFGIRPDFASLQIEGIRKITAADIAFAAEFGHRIKLLGVAKRIDGQIMQIMAPALVPLENPIGVIEDVYNAVYIGGDSVETPFMSGRGAGQDPTASAVMSDIIDLARGFKVPTFGIPADQLQAADYMSLADTVSRYYMRLTVLDQAGVIADVSAILRDLDISIEGLIQRGRDPGQPVTVVITTHESRHGAMIEACKKIGALKAVVDEPCLIRIEPLE
jgi:homoserine dehydrogenase